MFIWLRRVFSEFVSITYWRTSPYLHTGKQRRCHHVSVPAFYGDIFVRPIKRKTTLSGVLHWCLPGDCRDLFAKFFRRDDGGQSKRRFVGHICRCRLGFVFNPYERNRKVRLSDNIRHTKDFRIRNPLYAPGTIIRVRSELKKDF